MQFKNLFNFRNIRNILIVAVLVFFILPLIVPEKTEISVIQKESVSAREESPLPIFPRENVVERYTKRFKKLYHLSNKVPLYGTPQEIVEEIQSSVRNADEVYAEDLFFSDDYMGEDDIFLANSGDTQKFIDDTVNLQKGTVQTSDNLTLEPMQEGYYYNGKFYKNGTYPDGTDKLAIEGALNRYHSKVAGQLGKKALYYADENGNLTVDYVDRLPSDIAADIDTYRANNPVRTNDRKFNKDASLYAKAKNYSNGYDKAYDRYRGARINGLNQRTDNGKDISYSDIAAASLHDMHAAYDLASHKIQTGEIGQDINIDPTNHNASQNIAQEYLNTLPTGQPAQGQENTVPSYTGNPDDVLNIPVGKEKDFVEEFTEQISNLNCGGGNAIPSNNVPVSNVLNMNMFQSIDVGSGTSCGGHIDITLPENMSESIVYNGNDEALMQNISEKIADTEKTSAEIISTQQNFPTLLATRPKFTNKNGENVSLYHIAFGPNNYQDPKDTQLSSYYENIINTIAPNQSEANQLRESIDTYYDSVKENLNKPTIFISGTDDTNKKVFIEYNPKTGYIGPLPKALKNKDGSDVIMIGSQMHSGSWISYNEFMQIVDDGNVNMYIVSNQGGDYPPSCTDNKTCFKNIQGDKAFSTQITDISENIDGQLKLTEQGTKTNKKEGRANADRLRRNFGTTPANQSIAIKTK